MELAPAQQIFEAPAHPYTKELIAAVPQADPNQRTNFNVDGEIANPSNLPPGRAFHLRCGDCFAPCN